MHVGHRQSKGYLCRQRMRRHQNTAMETQGCIQDRCTRTPAFLILFLLPFSKGSFLSVCLGLQQPLNDARNTLPERPTVTPLLQGACYSPFLNGSNLRTFRIMIHEATLED